MIEFEKITVKNFCSYGNHPSEIVLNKDATTLVVGKNGRGKSTILLDGVFFALFGKPYRKVTKSLLVNSINKGGTLVELTFNTRGSTYLVRRGIKPNIFEVHRDSQILDSNVMVKDLQIHLEEDILGLNIRTFGQTSVLGSTSFVPFMQLEAAKRREVVDDVLGVGVYTAMSKLAKEDLDLTKSGISKVSAEIATKKATIEGLRRLIEALNASQQNVLTDIQRQIDDTLDSIASTSSTIAKLELERSSLTDQLGDEDFPMLYARASQELRAFQTSKQRIQDKVSDLTALTSCPHCLQKVTDGHKHSIATKSGDKLVELEIQIQAQQEIVSELLTKSDSYKSTQQELATLTPTINYTKKDKLRLDDQLTALRIKLDSAKTSTTSIDSEKEKLRECATEGKKLVETLSDLEKKRSVQELSVLLLKDSGIKARIVKDYLPVLNGLVNKYLAGYEFEINFTLDENFNESVQSRGREAFTYHSFSEGEKEKIDYAIMLALRQIAASKNAAHINILVLDEVLDGSLDEESRSATLEMLAADVEQSNIFVISHTESNPGHYDAIIKVDKKGDFSFLQEVT